jgi:hypothetical protein
MFVTCHVNAHANLTITRILNGTRVIVVTRQVSCDASPPLAVQAGGLTHRSTGRIAEIHLVSFALLVGVDDSVTTHRKSAVHTTCVRFDVTIVITVITLLIGIHTTIPTEGAGSNSVITCTACADFCVTIAVAVIACLVRVDHAIATPSQRACQPT